MGLHEPAESSPQPYTSSYTRLGQAISYLQIFRLQFYTNFKISQSELQSPPIM
jgi:hypothetical protein